MRNMKETWSERNKIRKDMCSLFTVHLWFLGYFMECFLESMNECSYKRKMEGWFVFMCPVLGLQIILENIIEIIPENMRKKMKERSPEGGRYWWMICIQVSWNQDLTRAEAAVQCQQVTTCQYPSIGVIFDDGRQR